LFLLSLGLGLVILNLLAQRLGVVQLLGGLTRVSVNTLVGI
jgi:hypothetical protein